MLLFIKNKSKFENSLLEPGLVTGEETLAEVVNKDTDGDGVLNWEEGLWGTDPTKKDTNNDGTEDGGEIARLKTEYVAEGEDGATTTEENLTQTDKFSRELFTTIVSLNQAGEVDQATADKLGESLVEQMKNYAPKRIFLISEIKTIEDNSAEAMQTYITTIDSINKKYPQSNNVVDILEEFVGNGEVDNVAALSKLDPIMEQSLNVINELVKMSVPSDLSILHLEMVNTLEQIAENLNDIQLFDIDPIVSMGAISQYEENTNTLDITTNKLGNIITQKLNN